MTKISICMMASKPDLMMQAVKKIKSLCRNDYHEFIIAASPKLTEEELEQLKTIYRVKIIPGTDSVENAGEVRYRMLDTAEGDWIINVDDDDLWYFMPMPLDHLETLDPSIGMCHGAALFIRANKDMRSEDALLMKIGREIKTPKEASSLGGSFWILRKKAWEMISPHLERIWWYSDWRIAYYLIHFGWKIHSATDKLLGVVRGFGSNYPTDENWSWPVYSEKLAEKLASNSSISAQI